MPRNFAKKSLLGFETKGYVQVRTDRRFERGIKAYLLRYLLTTTLTGLIRSGVLATYFVYIPSIHGITAIFSAAALQSKKGPRQKENITVCFFFFFSCRCCYSCKQKSRHPIIPVEERERQDPRQPASQPPPLPPPKKKKQNWQGYHLSKAWIIVRAHHYLYLLQSYTLADVRYSRNSTLFRNSFLSFSLFLSFCPALPPPIRNSASQDPLRACVSCLSCLVSFSPPGRTTTLFTLSLDIDTNLSRNRPHRISIPLLALLTKTKWKKRKTKESLPR